MSKPKPLDKQTTQTPGLVIRFDGPPSHESGRFVEVEIDGKSRSVGEWKQDGEYWLLVLGPTYAAAPDLLSAAKAILLSESILTTGETYLEYRALEEAVKKATGER